MAPVVSLFLPEVLLELQTSRPFSDAQMQEVIYLPLSCDLNASVVVVIVVVVVAEDMVVMAVKVVLVVVMAEEVVVMADKGW